MQLSPLAILLLLAFLQNSRCSLISNFNEIAQDMNNNRLDLFSLIHNNPMEQKDTVEQCPVMDVELLRLSQCQLMKRVVILEAEMDALMEKINLPVLSKSLDRSATSRNKRKNEFIRFGKRNGVDESELPHISGFTGTMTPLSPSFAQIPFTIQENSKRLSLKKRKNEFIRFG